jgi:hypothetical protein
MSRADRDAEVRARLERSRESLFGGGEPALLGALQQAVPGLRRAYVIDWIPEQGEDLYTVLVSETAIVTLEIERYTGVASDIRMHNIHQYRRDHRKMGRALRTNLEQALALFRAAREAQPDPD